MAAYALQKDEGGDIHCVSRLGAGGGGGVLTQVAMVVMESRPLMQTLNTQRRFIGAGGVSYGGWLIAYGGIVEVIF